MDNYFLKVNYILGYDNKKEIFSYELYNNDKLINEFNNETARKITNLIKNNHIKAKHIGFNYIIDDQKFIKKTFFKNKQRHIQKFNLKKAVILSSLAAGSILALASLKNHKNNPEVIHSNIDVGKINPQIDEIIFEDKDTIDDNNLNNEENLEKETADIKEDADIKENDNIDFYFDNNEVEKSTYEFSYEDKSNSYDIEYVKNNYLNSINYNSNAYGNDSELISAIIAHENYNNTKNYSNVGGHGVMQIESIWNGYNITAFNFDINDYETITIDTMRATDDIDYCIKVGCMIFSYQYNYINDKYDNLSDDECLIATLYSYNKGLTAVDNCLNNSSDFNDFLYQIINVPFGDNEYTNHVLSYIPDETKLHLKTNNGDVKEITIDNTLINNEKEPSL